MKMYYFAYGSNMLSSRMQYRAPSADAGVAAFVDGYVLRFHKRGQRDGSAKCDAFETGNAADRLYGVLYQITDVDKAALDMVEGLGLGYCTKAVAVTRGDSESVDAWMYVADALFIDPTLSPKSWYVKLVLDGALEHRLPHDYIREYIGSAFPFKFPG